MGVSHDVSLMVGVRKSDVVKTKRVVETVKKFNEDTGEPYEKEVFLEDQLFFGTKKISEPYDVEEWFTYGYTNEDGEDDIIGKMLSVYIDLNYGGLSEEIDMVAANDLIESVYEKLKEFGIEEKAKLYLVCNVG